MLHHLLLPPWKGCGAHCGLGGRWEPWGSRGKGGAQQVSSAAHCDEGGPSGLQAGRRASRQQEGLEGLSRELQARQSDVSVRAGYGAGDPECCDMAHASNGGIRSSWRGILKARCLLTTLISYDKVTHLVALLSPLSWGMSLTVSMWWPPLWQHLQVSPLRDLHQASGRGPGQVARSGSA